VVCGVVHTGLICPGCGRERKPVSRIESAAGELVEITGKVKKPTMADKQLFWSMALRVDRDRGKGGRMAKALYRSKFGMWPRGLEDRQEGPDHAFMNYVKSRQIAYAKSRGAR